MATVSVRVVSHPATIAKILRQPGGNVSRYLNARADRVVNAAKTFAPVRSGALRASIRKFDLPDGAVGVGSDLDYASYVERGTSRMRAQPYLAPALRSVIGR